MKYIPRVGTVIHTTNDAHTEPVDPKLYQVDKSKYDEKGFTQGLSRKMKRKLGIGKSNNFMRRSLKGNFKSTEQKIWKQQAMENIVKHLDQLSENEQAND